MLHQFVALVHSGPPEPHVQAALFWAAPWSCVHKFWNAAQRALLSAWLASHVWFCGHMTAFRFATMSFVQMQPPTGVALLSMPFLFGH
jgi:hypothetical protein